MAAHLAAPIIRIFCDTRQQLAGFCCSNYCNSAIAGRLGELNIERHQKMQALTGVGIHNAE